MGYGLQRAKMFAKGPTHRQRELLERIGVFSGHPIVSLCVHDKRLATRMLNLGFLSVYHDYGTGKAYYALTPEGIEFLKVTP